MKRRLICFLALLILTFLFTPAVFAKEAIVRIEIEITSPVAGEKPEDPSVRVIAQGEGEARVLSEEKDDYDFSARWQEAGADDPFTGSFIQGRHYEAVISLKNLLLAYNLEAEMELSVNGSRVADRSIISVRGNDVFFNLPFTAVPGDITPAVAAAPEGTPQKIYDGNPVILHATVRNLLDGVTYTYQWYKNGTAVPGAAAADLALKNAADSGVYVCRVVAASGQERKTTDSLELVVVIEKRPVTIVLENAEKNDGDPDPVLTYTLLGEIFDPLEGEPEREEGEAEGDYTISLGSLFFGEEAAGNYLVTVQEGKFTIVGTGVVTFAPVADVADLSYITGKSGARIRVSATKSALPKGAILSLSTVSGDALAALTEVAGEKGLMKSLSLSLIGEDGAPASLRKNAVLRLYFPLTEEEEQYEAGTVTAVFRTQNGVIRPLALRREVGGDGSIQYLVAEIDAPGEVALIKGAISSAVASSSNLSANANPARKKGAAWLWVLIILFSLAALGVIVFVLIHSRQTETPTKTYVPKQKPAPVRPPIRPEPGPNAGEASRKVISFEALEDDDASEKKDH